MVGWPHPRDDARVMDHAGLGGMNLQTCMPFPILMDHALRLTTERLPGRTMKGHGRVCWLRLSLYAIIVAIAAGNPVPRGYGCSSLRSA
jgi:hypothetical protein